MRGDPWNPEDRLRHQPADGDACVLVLYLSGTGIGPTSTYAVFSVHVSGSGPTAEYDLTSTSTSGNAVLTLIWTGQAPFALNPTGSSVDDTHGTPHLFDRIVPLTNQLTSTSAPCFVEGTLIRTPRGDVPVETLKSAISRSRVRARGDRSSGSAIGR
jgi:hypothetical protein